jgi:subtilisin family serine protease
MLTVNAVCQRALLVLRTSWLAGLLLVGVLMPSLTHAASIAVDGEILLRLQSTQILPGLLAKYPLTVIDQFGARPIYRLRADPSIAPELLMEAIGVEPGVLAAEPNFLHSSPEARKNNPWALGEPSDFVTQWAPTAMRLAEAHRFSRGAGVRVAVLDTGVDFTHVELRGKLLPGFDFVDFDSDPSEVGDARNPGFGHGTHVAGLVAMVAPQAQIMPLRVLDADGVGNAWVLAEAMLYAVNPDGDPTTNDGAHVINMSLGSTQRTHILDAIAKLVSCALPGAGEPVEPDDDVTDPGFDNDRARCAQGGGAVLAAAAGNNGTDSLREYPASEGAYGLMSVGASTSDERLARFSNFGSKVHIAAPGEGITSALPGGRYGSWSGTSMATPLVAGTAALLRSLDPTLSADAVVQRLLRDSAALCGTALRRVDALAVLSDLPPGPQTCR